VRSLKDGVTMQLHTGRLYGSAPTPVEVLSPRLEPTRVGVGLVPDLSPLGVCSLKEGMTLQLHTGRLLGSAPPPVVAPTGRPRAEQVWVTNPWGSFTVVDDRQRAVTASALPLPRLAQAAAPAARRRGPFPGG
jgi:hypothetical protein